MDREEFAHRLEVRANIAREAQRERDIYARGVKALAEAKGIEASDYSVNSVTLANGVKWYNS
jgi:hypothetical protein